MAADLAAVKGKKKKAVNLQVIKHAKKNAIWILKKIKHKMHIQYGHTNDYSFCYCSL